VSSGRLLARLVMTASYQSSRAERCATQTGMSTRVRGTSWSGSPRLADL
jgi:hypothetical protein